LVYSSCCMPNTDPATFSWPLAIGRVLLLLTTPAPSLAACRCPAATTVPTSGRLCSSFPWIKLLPCHAHVTPINLFSCSYSADSAADDLAPRAETAVASPRARTCAGRIDCSRQLVLLRIDCCWIGWVTWGTTASSCAHLLSLITMVANDQVELKSYYGSISYFHI